MFLQALCWGVIMAQYGLEKMGWRVKTSRDPHGMGLWKRIEAGWDDMNSCFHLRVMSSRRVFVSRLVSGMVGGSWRSSSISCSLLEERRLHWVASFWFWFVWWFQTWTLARISMTERWTSIVDFLIASQGAVFLPFRMMPIWKLSSSGSFSVKSFYLYLSLHLLTA